MAAVGTVDRIAAARADFPLLESGVAYLDNAATSQKPLAVIEAERQFYLHDNANIHRSVHALGERATAKYEAARATLQKFVGAAEAREIIFVRGTTEAINLVARTLPLQAGDEILVTGLEHHSNIVPWQLACEAAQATLRVAPINDRGEVDQDAFAALLSPRTKLASFAHISNALGTVNPVRAMVERAHRSGAKVLVDGAQAAPHAAIDVRTLDADFYALSGHKMYGPTGTGILYGKAELLNALPPWQGGGDMIESVTFAKTTYNQLPYKFEAGTPNIAGAIGLAAAAEYLAGLGLDAIAAHEHELLQYATAQLEAIPGLRIIGTARDKAAVISFVMDGIHPHDVGTVLDSFGVAVRAGHHCAQPVMERYGIPATTRASLGLYNTREDVDRLAAGLLKVKEMFS